MKTKILIAIASPLVAIATAMLATLGLPQCSVAAEKTETEIRDEISEFKTQNATEHVEFRKAIVENMREILRRLPPPKDQK
jgi:hypothetical protein